MPCERPPARAGYGTWVLKVRPQRKSCQEAARRGAGPWNEWGRTPIPRHPPGCFSLVCNSLRSTTTIGCGYAGACLRELGWTPAAAPRASSAATSAADGRRRQGGAASVSAKPPSARRLTRSRRSRIRRGCPRSASSTASRAPPPRPRLASIWSRATPCREGDWRRAPRPETRFSAKGELSKLCCAQL